MMPFCHAPARNPSGIYSCGLLLIFSIAACVDGMLIPDAVKVGDSAIIPCNKTCSGNLLWELTTKNEKLDVLRCVHKTCTEGDSFKNRTSPSKIQTGNLSLKLYPVLYNDEGWYNVLCAEKILCSFHLEVFVPTTVNATIRSNVTLPCYAHTEKKISDGAVNILWKKDDQIVLQVEKGITKYGSGFTGRASVTLPHYKDGDLSLTILGVTTSDKGLYRCYHNTEEEHGDPGAVTLNVKAHQKFFEKKFGDDLTIDLFGSDPVTITFTGSSEIPVCSVMGNDAKCSPEYTNRVLSVMNSSLVLVGLTSSDRGTFTVKDKMGEVIGIITVNVDVAQRYRYVPLFVLIAIVIGCICLCFWCYKITQAPDTPLYYNAGESTVVEPQREPASIGLSQQETSPNVTGESEVYARTPVEETMPMMVNNEKPDNSEEEKFILHLE